MLIPSARAWRHPPLPGRSPSEQSDAAAPTIDQPTLADTGPAAATEEPTLAAHHAIALGAGAVRGDGGGEQGSRQCGRHRRRLGSPIPIQFKPAFQIRGSNPPIRPGPLERGFERNEHGETHDAHGTFIAGGYSCTVVAPDI